MNELWMDIPEYEDLYKVSNKGNIMSLSVRNRMINKPRNKILKPTIDQDGYFKVSLCKNNKKRSAFVHRIVAEVFLENSNNLPLVNHKDENKRNNQPDNLEWCTIKYNTNYNGSHIKRGLSQRVPIVQYALDMVLVKVWSGRVEAAKYLKVNGGNIGECCAGRRKTAYGFIWRYLADL